MADPQGGMRLFPDGTRMGCALVVISSQLLLELITTSRAITDSYTATAPWPSSAKRAVTLDGTSISAPSWTNTSAEHPSLSRQKSTKGSPPCFSYTAIGSRHVITTNEDDGTVATKTKKALDSQRKPRLFVKSG